jgi:hypothetical protein
VNELVGTLVLVAIGLGIVCIVCTFQKMIVDLMRTEEIRRTKQLKQFQKEYDLVEVKTGILNRGYTFRKKMK